MYAIGERNVNSGFSIVRESSQKRPVEFFVEQESLPPSNIAIVAQDEVFDFYLFFAQHYELPADSNSFGPFTVSITVN